MKLSDLKGEWAVVTGASSGIGRVFATQLAARGVNLFLVARRQDLLDELGQRLRQSNGVECVALVQDLGCEGGAERVAKAVSARGVRPRLLVNNAAFGHWGDFSRASARVYETMVTVNAVAPVVLCRVFAEDLASHATAAVINVSSPAVFQPIPYMAVYAASKCTLHNFSLALSEEWREKGVLVQTLLPPPTATEFDAKAGAYGSALGASREPPEGLVELSLRALEQGSILVSSAKGLLGQRIFGALFPPAFVVKKVAAMFRPPR